MDVVIDMRIPFVCPVTMRYVFDLKTDLRSGYEIFATASPMAVVPEEIKEKVQASGLGIFSSWAPQQMILGHTVGFNFAIYSSSHVVLIDVFENRQRDGSSPTVAKTAF